MQRAMVAAGLAGLALGLLLSMINLFPLPLARAANADRYQDFVMCTGAVTINPRYQTDGVWLLDYRSGKLLGTVIDRNQGKIVGWAEVDLAAEFSVEPKADVHFLMTTGYITQGQSALYIAETTTGKFGVYTMGPGVDGSGIVIRRHDMTSFRMVQQPAQPVGGMMPGMPIPNASLPNIPTLPPAASPAPAPLPGIPRN